MKSNSRMYEDHPYAVEFYDHMQFVQNLGDLDFWVEEATAIGGPALELGVGTGRVLIPLARAGVDVVGLDSSQRMLDRCREKLQQESEEVRARVELVCSGMEEFRIDRKFGLIYSPFRSFQILQSIEDQLRCLVCAKDHLKDDGRLILDVFDPHLPFLIDENRNQEFKREDGFTMPDGRKVDIRARNPEVDLTTQTMACEQIFYVDYPDGRQERLVQSFRIRFLYRFELEHLLARGGFEIEHVYGGFDRCPFGTHRPGEMVVVAKKAR